MILALLILATLALAFANGANDIFKGVATLFGSKTTGYRTALVLAVGSTLLGSLAALFLATGLIQAFSGKGLVPDGVAGDPSFLAAVGLGAALTVLLATRMGLPISTTHSLTGGLVGAGLAAGAGLSWGALGSNFLLPLLASPVLALLVTAVLYQVFRFWRRRLRVDEETALEVSAPAQPPGDLEPAAAAPVALVATSSDAAATAIVRPASSVTVTAPRVLAGAHVVSASAVGFARGLNDTPKMVALLVGAQAMPQAVGIVLVGVVMVVGGLVMARRVAETMSNKITPMNEGQGFTANVVTAGLVVVASRFGLPVSTTHVSCGSLFGLGAVRGDAYWATIGKILLAWVVTLPVAAGLAALALALT